MRLEKVNREFILKTFQYNPEDGLLFRKLKNGSIVKAGTLRKDGRIQVRFNGRLWLASILIWIIIYDRFPVGEIDHINCMKADDRKINLREATRSQNAANQKRSSANSSGVKGVHWDKTRSKWMARITISGTIFNLGRYSSIEEAKAVYEKNAKTHFGEFARIG